MPADNFGSHMIDWPFPQQLPGSMQSAWSSFDPQQAILLSAYAHKRYSLLLGLSSDFYLLFKKVNNMMSREDGGD